jgi:hypothetical protein
MMPGKPSRLAAHFAVPAAAVAVLFVTWLGLRSSLPFERRDLAIFQMSQFLRAAERYAVDNCSYPPALSTEELGRLLKSYVKVPLPSVDPWGTPWRYSFRFCLDGCAPEPAIRLVSAGPDGIFSTADELRSTSGAESSKRPFTLETLFRVFRPKLAIPDEAFHSLFLLGDDLVMLFPPQTPPSLSRNRRDGWWLPEELLGPHTPPPRRFSNGYVRGPTLDLGRNAKCEIDRTPCQWRIGTSGVGERFHFQVEASFATGSLMVLPLSQSGGKLIVGTMVVPFSDDPSMVLE